MWVLNVRNMIFWVRIVHGDVLYIHYSSNLYCLNDVNYRLLLLGSRGVELELRKWSLVSWGRGAGSF